MDQVVALVADRYLDALLAAGERRALDTPADPALDATLREAVQVLRRSLVRVHPSFRFEERLAGRLADLAAAQASAGRVGAGGALIRFPGAVAAPGAILDADPLLGAMLAGDLDPADQTALDHAEAGGPGRRPLIVGGAITSAALSIVGVAIVAWRATRPATRTATATAMARAARTAHARRAAAVTAALPGGSA
jgi:hypothetical protein